MELLFNTQNIIQWGGIALIVFLVYAETGLLLGLIIPGGETLIFSSGLFVSTGVLQINIILFLALLFVAGIAGDFSGYTIARRYGTKLYKKEDTWYFKKKYLALVEDYFNRHKKMAVLIGKFMPVIRPFIPVVAGITKMKKAQFFPLAISATIVYISFFLLSGYFLGNQFPEIKNYLGYILPASILVLLIPVLLQIRKNKNKV
jgi:membrane-associated protein